MELGSSTPGQAARDALNAHVPPLDLSAYRTAAGGAGVLAGAPVVNPCRPGAGPDAAGRINQVLPYLTIAGHASCQLTGDQLGDLASDLLEASDRIERSLVFVLADAITRGVVSSSTAGSPTQWLIARMPALEPAQAHRVVTAAWAVTSPANAALTGALADGTITVRCAVTALRQLPKVAVALPGATREELLGYFLTIAQGGGTTKDLNDLAKKVIATYGGETASRDEDLARSAESLTFRDLPCGLTRVTADLSPADAAVFRSAVEGLAGPRPGTAAAAAGRQGTGDGSGSGDDRADRGAAGGTTGSSASGGDDTGGDGNCGGSRPTGAPAPTTRDPRSAGKRRADALMELVATAGRVSRNDAGRAGARVNVSVPLSVLVGSLVNAGFGTTDLGDVLDAGTARTMACSAQLVPMVLGTDSQPLDVGRASRTFTPSTRAAIVHRDSGCTYPGCDRPAPWCEAHHAVPWWVGGRSELSNGVLLCSRHHHVVHSRGYLPRIGSTRVTWTLTPAEMPTRPLDPGDPLTHGPGGPPGTGEHAA